MAARRAILYNEDMAAPFFRAELLDDASDMASRQYQALLRQFAHRGAGDVHADAKSGGKRLQRGQRLPRLIVAADDGAAKAVGQLAGQVPAFASIYGEWQRRALPRFLRHIQDCFHVSRWALPTSPRRSGNFFRESSVVERIPNTAIGGIVIIIWEIEKRNGSICYEKPFV